MDDNNIEKTIINNEFDYSNIVPTEEMVDYLVKVLDQYYGSFLDLIKNDEEKNKQFKPEFQEFQYKKTYEEKLEIYISKQNYNSSITCKDYESFHSAVEEGNLKDVLKVKINLSLYFKRGRGKDLEEHENDFIISFQPYDIKFIRKSNHNDPIMNKIEEQINTILKNFPIANSIFCNKD